MKKWVTNHYNMLSRTMCDAETSYMQAKRLGTPATELERVYDNLLKQYIKLARLDEGFADMDEHRDEHGRVIKEAEIIELNLAQRARVAQVKESAGHGDWEAKQREILAEFEAEVERHNRPAAAASVAACSV